MKDEKDKKKRRRGQVIPRGENTFLIRVALSRDSATGKRLYHSETFYGTKTKAEKRCTQVQAQIDEGTFFEPSQKSVNELLDQWLKHVGRQGVRPVTLGGYEDHARIYIRPAIGAIPLARLKPLDVQGLFDGMQDRGLAPLTIRNSRRVLVGALEQAIKWRLLKENPARGITTPKAKRRKVRSFDEREAAAFIAAARENPDDLIFIFVLCTGLRPVEFIGLRWPDVELVSEIEPATGQRVERGIAHIRQTIVRNRHGGGWQFSEPKTENGVRDVYFPATLYRELMKQREQQEQRKAFMGRNYHDHGIVFACANGEPVERGSLSKRRFKPLLTRAGLSQEFSLYTLRRSFATLSLLAGASRKEVSEQMGHASVNFTEDVYVSVLPRVKQVMSDSLEKLLFSDVGTLPAHNEASGVM